MVYNAMFPRNPQPENLTELMGKFKDVRNIHDFVKPQMVASVKFALIWLKICHSKLDLDKVVESLLLKMSKRKVNIDKHNAVVSPVTEKMIDELLKVDTTFFKEYRYDDSTQNICAARENIDRWILKFFYICSMREVWTKTPSCICIFVVYIVNFCETYMKSKQILLVVL